MPSAVTVRARTRSARPAPCRALGTFSTLITVTPRSIFLISPASTVPGPSSTNVRTPSATSRLTTSSQRTGDDTCRISASIASAASRFGSRVDVGDDRESRGSCDGERPQLRRQALLGRLHQRAMERRADGQRQSTRLAPRALASSPGARHGLRRAPAITICPGAFRFAGDTTPTVGRLGAGRRRRRPRRARESPPSRPRRPAPPPACIALAGAPCAGHPRRITYRPRRAPSTRRGCGPRRTPRRCPRDRASRATATLTARIAGCVFSVSSSRSSGPSKHSVLSGSPSAASASANVSRQIGNASASARPMPTFCAPCPGNTNAIIERRLCASASSQRRMRGDLARQPVEQALGHGARRHRDGVAHRLRRRPAVPDDAEAVEADERRAAVLGVVDAACGSGGTPGATAGSRRACRTSPTARRAAAPRPSRPALR